MVAGHLHPNSKGQNLSLIELLNEAEEEGFDCANFTSILRQISNDELGETDTNSLCQYCQSIASKPNGIELLREHLAHHFPKLEKRLMDIGALVAEENNVLQGTAGGMSKGAIAGISVGSLALVGLGGVGIHKWRTSSKAKKIAITQRAEAQGQIDKEAAAKAYNREVNNILYDGFTELDFKHILKPTFDMHYEDLEEHTDLFRKISEDFDFKGYARDLVRKGERWGAFDERELEIKMAGYIRNGAINDFDKLTDVERKIWEKAKGKNFTGISPEQLIVEDPNFRDWFGQKIVARKHYELFANDNGFLKDQDEIDGILEDLKTKYPDYIRTKMTAEEVKIETDVRSDVKVAVGKEETDLLETANVEEKALKTELVDATDQVVKKAAGEVKTSLIDSIGSLEDDIESVVSDIEIV